MIKFLLLFMLLPLLPSEVQQLHSTYTFQYYKNGKSKNPKNIEFYIVNENLGTLQCKLSGGTINMPKISAKSSIIVHDEKATYVIEDVDFSHLDENCMITFGINTKVKHLTPLSEKFPNFYAMNNKVAIVKIDDIQSVKELCFITFNSVTTAPNTGKLVKNYSQSTIIRTK